MDNKLDDSVAESVKYLHDKFDNWPNKNGKDVFEVSCAIRRHQMIAEHLLCGEQRRVHVDTRPCAGTRGRILQIRL